MINNYAGRTAKDIILRFSKKIHILFENIAPAKTSFSKLLKNILKKSDKKITGYFLGV